MKKFGFIAFMVVLYGSILMAQDITPNLSFVVNMDYARFHYDDRSGYLEIYYSFHPYILTYRWSENQYRAGVKLRTRLQNQKTKTLEVNEQAMLPYAVMDTSDVSFRYPFITQAGYAVPLGEYTLEVIASDSLNPSRRDSISLKISIGAYTSEVVCSDLELCSNIKSSVQKDDPFYKNALEVVPNPTLIFGITNHPVVFDYLELYNLNPEETYKVKTLIIDSDGQIVKESSKTSKYGVENVVEVGTTNATSIVSGKYNFQFLLFDQNSRELARTEKTFFVYNPHLQVPSSTVYFFDTSELAGLSAKELSDEFRQAQYIATDQEIKMFAQLDTESGKREFFGKFWESVQKGRLGHPPIKRGDYLRLVKTANERFSVGPREGWKTDRGRVYIIYGEPNEIERHPSLGEVKPYEIWYYYEIEGGVQFYFIERRGGGDFDLVHSTKRGELRNDKWEELLLLR